MIVNNIQARALMLAATMLSSTGVTAQTCITDSILPTTAEDRFIVRDLGVIVDAKTGLTWTRCPVGQTFNGGSSECEGSADAFTDWEAAMGQVSVANSEGLGGKAQWRAPSIKELGSIVERQCYEPAINLALFPGTENAIFWTSTPRNVALKGEPARYIDFTTGEEFSDALVISGQLRLVHD